MNIGTSPRTFFETYQRHRAKMRPGMAYAMTVLELGPRFAEYRYFRSALSQYKKRQARVVDTHAKHQRAYV